MGIWEIWEGFGICNQSSQFKLKSSLWQIIVTIASFANFSFYFLDSVILFTEYMVLKNIFLDSFDLFHWYRLETFNLKGYGWNYPFLIESRKDTVRIIALKSP